MCRAVSKGCRESERKLSGRAHVAEEHVCQGVAGFRTAVPGLDYGRNGVEPRHGDGIARYQADNYVRIDCSKCRNKFALIVREVEKLSVTALAILSFILVETSDKNHEIRLAGKRKSFVSKGLRIPVLIDFDTGGDSVLRAVRTSHVSPRIFHFDSGCGCTVADSLERRDFVLSLER